MTDQPASSRSGTGRRRQVLRAALLAATATLAACESPGTRPDPLDRGAYLVGLLGCGQCHTDGALLGQPQGSPLAGSRTGIAVSEWVDGQSPAVVFPGNLTPDVETGIGSWSRDAVVGALRHGRRKDWTALNPVMPWLAYGNLVTEDLYLIADYLLSQRPVRRKVPGAVAPGTPTAAPYVRIGVYLYNQSHRPDGVYRPAESDGAIRP